jgi:hypothetical protein
MLTDRELLTRRTQHEAKLERLEKWLRQLGKSKTPAAAYSRQFLTAERDKTLAAFARADAAMPALEAARLADQAAADALNAHNAQPAATSVDGELQVLAVRNILSRRVNEASAALEAARQAAALPSFQDLIQ